MLAAILNGRGHQVQIPITRLKVFGLGNIVYKSHYRAPIISEITAFSFLLSVRYTNLLAWTCVELGVGYSLLRTAALRYHAW